MPEKRSSFDEIFALGRMAADRVSSMLSQSVGETPAVRLDRLKKKYLENPGITPQVSLDFDPETNIPRLLASNDDAIRLSTASVKRPVAGAFFHRVAPPSVALPGDYRGSRNIPGGTRDLSFLEVEEPGRAAAESTKSAGFIIAPYSGQVTQHEMLHAAGAALQRLKIPDTANYPYEDSPYTGVLKKLGYSPEEYGDELIAFSGTTPPQVPVPSSLVASMFHRREMEGTPVEGILRRYGSPADSNMAKQATVPTPTLGVSDYLKFYRATTPIEKQMYADADKTSNVLAGRLGALGSAIGRVLK